MYYYVGYVVAFKNFLVLINCGYIFSCKQTQVDLFVMNDSFHLAVICCHILLLNHWQGDPNHLRMLHHY